MMNLNRAAILSTIIATLALVAGLAIANTAHAGPGSFLGGLSMDKKAPAAEYRLDVKGTDLRVYEWHPEEDPETTCVVAFAGGGEGAVGMSCQRDQEVGK